MKQTMYKTAAITGAAAMALATLGAWSSLAFADGGSTSVHVDNSNGANVINTLTVGAHTGGNVSLGGNGDNGGVGGNASGIGSLRGGNGGAGGSGGNGGHITTGIANALGQIETDANSNLTNLQLSGGSQHDSSNHTSVTSSNWASVINTLQVNANTGGNDVSGGNGANGGNGGNAAAAWNHWFHWWSSGESSTAGNGGAGGDGGNGGTVTTGKSTAGGTILNVLNSNVTRIHSTSSTPTFNFPF